MAVRNVEENYIKIEPPTTTDTGTLTFTGTTAGPINYSLNSLGNLYTLTIGPCMGIVSQGTLVAPNPVSEIFDDTIIVHVKLQVSDGTITQQTTGICMMTNQNITIYSSIGGGTFTTTDATHTQGWQNSFVISFSVPLINDL